MNLRTLLLAALLPASAFSMFHGYGDDKFVASTGLALAPGMGFSIQHNAMHWRKDVLERIESGALKQRFAPDSFRRNFGKAKVDGAVTLGGQSLAAGEWNVVLRVGGDDSKHYSLRFTQDKTSIDVPLEWKGGMAEEDHMLVALTPRGGAQSNDFVLEVSYGDMKSVVAGSFGAAAAAAPPAK